MKAEIICVGTELTVGDRLNTNSQYLAKELYNLGISVSRHTIIEDSVGLLKKAFNDGMDHSDIIVLTGGLGPTEDDFTKEVVAECMGRELVKDNNIKANIENMFKKRNMEMKENNKKQYYTIKKSIILENENGTAPGYIVEDKEKIVIILPGPPSEMKPMMEKYVLEYLENKIQDNGEFNISVKTIGIGESQLEYETRELLNEVGNSEIELATYANIGEVLTKIKSKNKEKLDVFMEKFKEKFEENIYAYNDITLEEAVFLNLKKNSLKVGFCESCTGGLVTSKLTSLEGASKVLDRSVVTYSNKSKMAEVDVKEITLKTYGAVSEETSKEMAEGLFRNADIDISVSITGLASYEEGSLPTGLVYITLVTEDENITEKNIFLGDRNTVRERASKEVYRLIREYMIKKEIYIVQ